MGAWATGAMCRVGVQRSDMVQQGECLLDVIPPTSRRQTARKPRVLRRTVTLSWAVMSAHSS